MIEYREFEIREDDESGSLGGIAVPFGQVAEGIGERFDRDALADDVTVPLFYGHDHLQRGMPIGTVTGKNTDDGYHVEAKLADTVKAQEVRSLVKAGALSKFSIGFEPVEHRMDGDVLVRTAANLKEVSVVPFPAYDQASVSEVRDAIEKKEDVMTDVINTPDADLAEIRESITDLERKVAVATQPVEAPAGSQFRDAGTLLKALAAGDKAAQDEFRAADGTSPATSGQAGADAQNSWLARPMKLVQENRQILDLFAKAPLPSFGNTVEFPKVASTSGTVGKQAAEGDALSYMEVELGTGTATVGTYGGYSRLSRQSIERGDAAYLNKVLEYQALQYAKATEAAFRTTLLGVSGAGEVTLADQHSDATAQEWIDFVIDSAGAIEDDSLGLTADFIVVSRDVFKSIARLVDSNGRPIFALNGDGSNTVGEANVVRAAFNIGGLPGVVGPRLSANTAVVASKDAITTLESAGAPFRLNDENIVQLTQDFSLYGYSATTVNDVKGLVIGNVSTDTES